MTDINEYIYPILEEIFNLENLGWTTAIVEIESNLNYVGTALKFFNEKKECVSDCEISLTPKSKFSLIQMHKIMDNEDKTFEKWNKALLSIEKNGKFEISFEWNQDLQNKWDSAVKV